MLCDVPETGNDSPDPFDLSRWKWVMKDISLFYLLHA